ncbi:MAG: macro domain-containing protein [Planctomycetota bacterium]|jgi:O-acetyl-ADP-ribose deacetylase (regulator of RNase III)
MRVETVHGDLLDQDVEVVVNAWNRNIFPWWLLLPSGVSRAIKRRAGLQPFRELARHGPIPLGEAIMTSSGELPFKGIIHVAGIDLLWRASERSIRNSVRSAMRLYREHSFQSIAFPIIGGGSWGIRCDKALAAILAELAEIDAEGNAVVVRYRSN